MTIHVHVSDALQNARRAFPVSIDQTGSSSGLRSSLDVGLPDSPRPSLLSNDRSLVVYWTCSNRSCTSKEDRSNEVSFLVVTDRSVTMSLALAYSSVRVRVRVRTLEGLRSIVVSWTTSNRAWHDSQYYELFQHF